MVLVNFLPWRDQLLRARLHRWSLILLVLLAVFLAGLLPVVGLHTLNTQLAKAVQRQHEAGQQLNGVKVRIDALTRQRESLQQQFILQQQQQAHMAGWADFAGGLAMKLPTTLWLSELNKTPQRLTLAGFCLAIADVRLLRQQLLQAPLFSEVRTGKLSRDRQGVIRFSLQAVLKHNTVEISEQRTKKGGEKP
ncbi:hypothetical protein EHW65_17020 [Erwinia psidii]|uniref:PilN domain-containing protein n=1 Tax=Erwinia psidii TaxID=69224 RepID=UPI00226B5C9D|nr:PilN domain-containing protein [Erwinia psidii]MCX8958872.1 hypothetical protein [Erwinia psidii]